MTHPPRRLCLASARFATPPGFITARLCTGTPRRFLSSPALRRMAVLESRRHPCRRHPRDTVGNPNNAGCHPQLSVTQHGLPPVPLLPSSEAPGRPEVPVLGSCETVLAKPACVDKA
ncbi:hypothetical protein LUU34_00514900 [Aix galericulata]|nr:hypothetical protein LUU34_00514900 [Aix galericulata]